MGLPPAVMVPQHFIITPPASSTDQAMEATMAALAGAQLVGGPATAAERAATGVDTYLIDSDTDEEAETVTAIADSKLRGWSATCLSSWWGLGRRMRAKELCWALFAKGHKEDPRQAITFKRFLREQY